MKEPLNRHAWMVSDEGATAAEYAMMAAFIGAVVVSVVAAIGIRVAQFFVIPWP